jgi:uncharacterized protein YdgA (DUF945 family)
MKKIIGVIFLLALLIFGAFEVTGIMTQRTLMSNMQVLNQSTDFSVEIKDYHRSILRSTATMLITVQAAGDAQKKMQNYRIELPVKISHGPIIWNGKKILFGLGYLNAELNISPHYEKFFAQRFLPESVKPRLNVKVFVDLVNKSQVEIDLLPFQLTARSDHSQLKWQGLESNAEVTRGLRQVKGKIKIQGATFTKAPVSMIMGALTSKYDLQQTKQHLFLGDFDVTLPKFVIKKSGVKTWEMQQMSLHSSNNIHDGLFSCNLLATFQSLLTDKQIGPGVLNLSLKNLDADVLAVIQKNLHAMHAQGMLDQRQLLFKLAPKIPALLSKGAVLEVSEMMLTTPLGVIEGDLSLNLPENPDMNVFQIYRLLNGNGSLKIPAKIIQDMLLDSIKQRLTNTNQLELAKEARTLMDKQVKNLLSRGALVEQGQNYIINMKLMNGQLTINNKSFNEILTLSFAMDEHTH